MSLPTKAGFLLGAAAFSGMAYAGSGEVSYDDLQLRLDAAEARIAELSDSDWLTEQRSEQIRGIVQDVLADADTRASLQGNGATSGYNNGFFVQSADGKWSMKINGLFQERWNMGSARGAPTGGTSWGINGNYNTVMGFETTRAALNFSGTLAGTVYYNARLNWSPYNTNNNFTAQIQTPALALATTTQTGGGISNDQLEWAYGGWHVDDTWSVQIGRQKFDVMRSFMVNAEDQQAIERSAATYYWNTSTITNGLKLVGNTDQMRANVMFSNGSNSTAGNNDWTINQHGWAITGRAGFLLQGDWSQFDRIGSSKGETMGALLGIGAGYMRNADQSQNNWIVSADLSLDGDGWNLGGSVTIGDQQNIDGDDWIPTAGAAVPNNDGTSFGWEVEGGYDLNEDTAMYARWSWLAPGIGVGNPAVGDPSAKLNIFTIGLNHYLAGPNTKLSVDWSWSFNDPSTAFAYGNQAWGYTGWWANDGGNGGAASTGSLWLLRTQLQVSF